MPLFEQSASWFVGYSVRETRVPRLSNANQIFENEREPAQEA